MYIIRFIVSSDDNLPSFLNLATLFTEISDVNMSIQEDRKKTIRNTHLPEANVHSS